MEISGCSPERGASSRGFFDRDIAGMKTLETTVRGTYQQRTFVINARRSSRDATITLQQHDFVSAQHVEALPQIGEGRHVFSLDELFIGEENAPDQCCGEAVDVERCIRF